MTLAELRADLLSLAGLRLTTAQANALINEGNRELCTRAEWTRAYLELGPTVAGQAAYTMPSTVSRPLSLSVAGVPYHPTDEGEVERIEQGDLYLRSDGLWWVTFTSAGVEQVSLHPTPTTSNAGRAITLQAVVAPALLSAESAEPNVPVNYHRAIRDYVVSVHHGLREDNPELQAFHEERFEAAIARLRADRHSRGGRGGARMRVEGWTA